MNVFIDRIEEGIAVMISREDSTLWIRMPAALLPPGSREGDILSVAFDRDPAATDEAKARSASLIGRLKR